MKLTHSARSAVLRLAASLAADSPAGAMRRAAASFFLLLLIGFLVAGCDDAVLAGGDGPSRGDAVAFGIWTPGPNDSCTAEQHDRFSVVGPDGKRYPTWHPPTDPASGCSFGHEHGRDPRGSDLFGEVGMIPFGLANEALDVYDPNTRRHEDHVGHKIEWENDVRLSFDGAAGAVLEITCDVLAKLHQGTHSKDAFTNNLHELVYHIRCNDGTRMHVTLMAAIGTPGEFVASCDRERRIQAGTATPPNSPSGGGKRAIPDRICIERHMLVPEGVRSNYDAALRESWETHNQIRTVEGRTIASFDPYFQALHPSRFYDPSKPNAVGRPMDVCYEDQGGRAARDGLCEDATGNGAVAGITFDDPRSPFDGVRRFVDVNSNRIDNEDGPEVWYTDPFGRNARKEPFPGSIRQWIAQIDNTGRAGHGPSIGRQRHYGAAGVHPPN